MEKKEKTDLRRKDIFDGKKCWEQIIEAKNQEKRRDVILTKTVFV